ncbi:hypothetical protein C7N83_11730 [Neisseria iguanae]|uniref:Uncharacterized protein n=1 Tax=Neisseria iguanae TaxID=90242 RepID=A0A2P7TXT0_9NEIS|nr:hypothetical protein C7N83_11730 [Neisseria iguanae]
MTVIQNKRQHRKDGKDCDISDSGADWSVSVWGFPVLRHKAGHPKAAKDFLQVKLLWLSQRRSVALWRAGTFVFKAVGTGIRPIRFGDI